MTQTVTVPNVGDFEFPDGMSQEAMQSAIHQHLGTQPPNQNMGQQQPSYGIGNFVKDNVNALVQNINNIGGAIPYGLEQGARHIANIPLSMLGHPIGAPALPPFADPNSLLFKGTSAIAQTAPMAATIEARLPLEMSNLGKAIFSSAGSSALTSPGSLEDRLKSGLETAGLTGVLGGVGKAIPATASALKDYFSKFAAAGIGKNIANSIKQASDIDNNQAFELAKNNYQNYASKESSLWDALTNKAREVDQNPNISFDNQSYKDALSKKLSELQGQSSRQSGYQRANKDSLNMLEGYLDDQHNSFTDAIEHNKALNQDYTNEITPGKSLPFSTVNFAKQNIKKTIENNFNSNPDAQDLGSLWKAANNATAEKSKIFNEIASSKGQPQISKFSGILNKKADFTDPSIFVGDYVPSSKSEGIQKMQQFSQMIGDQQTANNILKKNYFKNAIDQSSPNGINIKTLIGKYNDLSEQQKNYLFNPLEKNQFEALNKMLMQDPKALDNPMVSHAVMSHIMPTTFGILGGFMMGHPFEGGVLGMLGGGVAHNMMNQLLARPALQQFAINNLTQKPQASLMSQMLMKALPYASAASMSQGGQ